MGNEHFSGKQGELYDNFVEANDGVKKMKEEYGHGMSTLIIIHNDTNKEVTFC